jgi:hypothetical protein
MSLGQKVGIKREVRPDRQGFKCHTESVRSQVLEERELCILRDGALSGVISVLACTRMPVLILGLGPNPISTTYQLCDLGCVVSPLFPKCLNDFSEKLLIIFTAIPFDTHMRCHVQVSFLQPET